MRVALVGAGLRASTNAQSLLATGAGEIAGVWSRNPATAEHTARLLGTQRFESVSDMVSVSRPDAVAIFTHPSYRSRPLAEAVDAGARAIIVEKPIALDAAELAAVRRAAGDAFVAVNTQYQWMPHWQQIFRLIAQGRLGTIHRLAASTRVDLRDQGPHLLSLALGALRAAGVSDAAAWVEARGRGTSSYGGTEGPADVVARIGIADVELTLKAGRWAPVAGAEPNRFLGQQVVIEGQNGTAAVTLNRGGSLTIGGEITAFDTDWERDDAHAQAAFWRSFATAAEQPEPSFPTRLDTAARDTALLQAVITAAASNGARLDLSSTSQR